MLLKFVRLLATAACLSVVLQLANANAPFTCINSTKPHVGILKIETCKIQNQSWCSGWLEKNTTERIRRMNESDLPLVMKNAGCGCKTKIMGDVAERCQIVTTPYAQAVYCCCEGEQCNTEAKLMQLYEKSIEELTTVVCSAQPSTLSYFALVIGALAFSFNLCYGVVDFGSA